MPPQTPLAPEILYADKAMLILDKPAGMPAQPTRFTERGTATGWALDYLRQKGIKQPFVAPAHRLDAPTSGVLCLAIDRNAAGALQKQFQTHTASRIYLAIVAGAFAPEETTLTHRLELDRKHSFARVSAKGREARTRVRVLEATPQRSLLVLAPETGLTHQIRVQLAAVGYPVLGDSRYGKGGAARLALHAWSLSLKHPHTGRLLHFEAPPKEDFWALWRGGAA